MAIKFFSRKDCRGRETVIDGDSSNTPSSLRTTASIALTRASDKILLFKKTRYRGEVVFLTGPVTVNDLDDAKRGFRNSVHSYRKTRFHFRIRFNVIQDSSGTLPNGFTSREDIERHLRLIYRVGSNILRDAAMIHLAMDSIRYRVDDSLFQVSPCGRSRIRNAFPNLSDDRIEVFMPGSTSSLGCAGSRRFGTEIVIAGAPNVSTADRARTLAHEIGHLLGLRHPGSLPQSNLMTQLRNAAPTDNTNLKRGQVERIHELLSDPNQGSLEFRR